MIVEEHMSSNIWTVQISLHVLSGGGEYTELGGQRRGESGNMREWGSLCSKHVVENPQRTYLKRHNDMKNTYLR